MAAASWMRKLSGSLFSQSKKLSQTRPVITGVNRCLSYWTQPSVQQSITRPTIQCTKETTTTPSPLLSVCIPLINSVRTMVRYSIRQGKPKTVRAVTSRFYRMPWGIYIRPRAGRHKKKWKKPDWINERGKYHVFTNKTQSRMLDKMTTNYWKKRRYYVNDPYEPYLKRTRMDYTPPKFLP